ncbi:MAG: glycosyltransferase family 4 protein [Acidobacteriia bacterium]|nr:glycosyltransferase family 4 protein [Terriglobia bacterium]
MMHLFLNGLAASAGGGLTYLRNVIPHLAARTDVRTTVTVSPQLRQELGNAAGVSLVELQSRAGATWRSYQEQKLLPGLIRESRADVLISAGNFALRNSPVPQVLLSRNSLYTSADFFRDLRARHEYRIWLDTRAKGVLARRSIHWADCTVAPSQAFADELQQWSGQKVVAIHHGFDHDTFFRDHTPLPAKIQHELDSAEGSFRVLFVSHYNYYRNFETLLRAIPLLQERLGKRPVKLFLTCKLRSEDNPGRYRAEAAAALVNRLGIGDKVVQLGMVPYGLLHHLYRACDMYVTAAYAESFAHPLVEAMASGLPVVASGLPVHHEICGAAAHYFQRFSSESLAEEVAQLACSGERARSLAEQGLQRSKDFSWSRHVQQLLELVTSLKEGSRRGRLRGAR